MQPSLFDLEPQVYTISDITAYIRRKFEADLTLRDLWLEGELSNWKQAASGHIYFTLKDAGASLRCVIWRSQARRLAYTPRSDGEALLAHGKISVYEAGGNYQFYVDQLEPLGQGALYMQFERLKARLAEEGLFEAALKKPLPPFPGQIGVVTSARGAALRDVLNVLRRRYPLAQVILSPAPVQADSAPPQLVAALEALSRQPVEVIILTRGGGSLEDLWAFNDEKLARTIAACPIPVVTGIGHEVDFTIADFVADVRAPTPSAAAELVVPDSAELKRRVQHHRLARVEAAHQVAAAARSSLQARQWSLERLSPQAQVNNYRQQTDSLVEQAGQRLHHRLLLQREQVNTLISRLEALNPQAILKRGYAIIHKGSALISRTGQVEPGDRLAITVADGDFAATVTGSPNTEQTL